MKIDKDGNRVNVTDGKTGFQETERSESTLGATLGPLTPAQPTRIPKSVLRRVLPTRADHQPILVFEHEGQQFWTNRFVMLDVETIAPYIGDLEAHAGAPVEARVTAGSLANVGEEFWYGNDRACINLMNHTEERLAASYPSQFDVTNPDLITYVEDGPDDIPYYLLTEDDEGLPNKHGPRVTKIRADYLHIALGTDDLSNVDPNITIEQAARGNRITTGSRNEYTPLVIRRGDRRVGMIMPIRLPPHLERP